MVGMQAVSQGTVEMVDTDATAEEAVDAMRQCWCKTTRGTGARW
jgi:hypothetical protein